MIKKTMSKLSNVLSYLQPDYPRDNLYGIFRLQQRIIHGWFSDKEYRERYWYFRTSISERFTVRVADRVNLVLEAGDILSRLIFVCDFENKERDFVSSFLRQGDIFFDIGANIGLFTVIAGEHVGASGQVHAFEPVSETWQKLINNIQLNDLMGIITANQMAISSCEQKMEIWSCRDGYSAWSSLGFPTVNRDVSMQKEVVQTISLDEYVRINNVEHISLIKIDVEGWETHVIRGAVNTLDVFSPVLMVEFTDANAKNAGSSTIEIREQLEQLGYSLFRYDMLNRRLVAEPVHGEYPYVDLIACKDESYVEHRLRESFPKDEQ